MNNYIIITKKGFRCQKAVSLFPDLQCKVVEVDISLQGVLDLLEVKGESFTEFPIIILEGEVYSYSDFKRLNKK